MVYQNVIHVYILIIGHDLITLNVQTKIYNQTRVIYIYICIYIYIYSKYGNQTSNSKFNSKHFKNVGTNIKSAVIGIEDPGKLNNTSL